MKRPPNQVAKQRRERNEALKKFGLWILIFALAFSMVGGIFVFAVQQR